MKILILGGYGVFGGRLARLLAGCAELELLIGGRSLAAARAFCQAYVGQARVTPLQVDRVHVAQALADQRPALLVDASGPFQDYGQHRYGVIEACIAAGVDYLDFADAADFVFGVDQFDTAAKAAGVFVLSGVSSFPVLTAAVVGQMARSMAVTEVEGGIAPSPYAGIGLNVMRAVVGYAGEPVTLRRGGKAATAPGLTESRRFTVAVPGRVPLANLRFSLVDVPDLQVIPPEHPQLADIWMGAGPLPESLHRVLNMLAKARAALPLPSLVPASRLFYAVLNAMKFGEHRGGMYVRARGLRDGQVVEQSWHLLAEGDDGPYIPSMAIEAVIAQLRAGQRPDNGARSGSGALTLADYDRLFAGRRIYTGWRLTTDGPHLYQALLGSAYAQLPAPVRALHGSGQARVWQGRARITRGRGLLARAVARVFGFPPAGKDVPVQVSFTPHAGGERWQRHFGSHTFSTWQGAGQGRNQYLLLERFGALCIAMALVVEGERLRLVPRRMTVLGVPLPRALLPNGDTFETAVGDDFVFDVTVALPWVGHVVSYQGRLRPA